MRIEVLVGNEDPVVYPLNAAKITLGTSENCDITINAEGISRKHITILTEGDNYFVIDQGSTNGSFINEERLIPGRKTEFTSFFPVRLGDNVLLTLISDEEGQTGLEIPATFKERTSPSIQREPAPEKTTVIPLKELTKAKTGKLVQNREQKRVAAAKKQGAKPAPKPKPKKDANMVPFLAVLIVVVAGGFNYYLMDEPEPEIPVVTQEIGKAPEVQVVEPPKEVLLIPESDLVAKEAYDTLQSDIKCATDVEINLCKFFPHSSGSVFGVVQVGLTIHVLADAAPYLESSAKKFVQSNGAIDIPESLQDSVNDIAALIYLEEVSKRFELAKSQVQAPAPAPVETQEAQTEAPPVAEPTPTNPSLDYHFDPANFKDMRFSIALMKRKDDGSLEVVRVISIKPEVFPKLKEIRFNEIFSAARYQKPGEFFDIKQRVRIY